MKILKNNKIIGNSFFLPVLFGLIMMLSCDEEKFINPKSANVFEYLHLGHTRTNVNPLMDSEVEKIDYSKYEMLWLGGDLAYLTSQDKETISHVDSIFNLNNPNTLFALGNHDYSDLNLLKEYTNREKYYSVHTNEITFIILDTQDSLSNIIGAQKELFDNVIDTIRESTHLIILHHKLIWMYGSPILEPRISSVSNGDSGDCFYCINPNNFYHEIYPGLVKVKNRGISVLCIGGDIGVRTKEFEYITDEGIYFLASGINAGTPDNKGLVFTHDVTNGNLTWNFKPIEDL